MENFKSLLLAMITVLVTIGGPIWVASKIGFIPSDIFLGLFVGLMPSVILIHQRNQDRIMDHKNWLLRNKEACAIELADIFISAREEKLSTTTQRFKHLMPAIVVWGSASLLKQLETIHTASDAKDNDEYIRRAELYFRTIRRDLGHKDENLKPGAISAAIFKPEEKAQAYIACKGERYE